MKHGVTGTITLFSTIHYIAYSYKENNLLQLQAVTAVGETQQVCHNWKKPFGIRGLEPTSFSVPSPTCPQERHPGDEFWTGAMIWGKEKKYSIPQSLSQIHPWHGAKGTRMSRSLIS